MMARGCTTTKVIPRRKVGRPAKSLEQHLTDGTYQPSRHGVDPDPLVLQKPVISRLPSLAATKRWIRSDSDERAVTNGCRFSLELAEYVEKWIAKYIRHSEGRWAGKPFLFMDWQRDELFYPLFGWVRKHEELGSIVRRFTRVYCEVPKKNGKSPTGAAIGTYMLTGDGEAGAKVFSVATDKDQASIVHTHAIHMVEDSPELNDLCRINRTTRRITFNPTRSVYSALSSEHRGSEGLNGNCAILDELHAWYGDQLYNSLKYMFAAREQPILFQITTAGSDMQGVCRQQHDYAQGILSGEIQDDGFLPIIHAASSKDDWTDEDVWRKANPSLGTTITLSDLRQSFSEAKLTSRTTSAFKRYRLCVWATAEEPWLDAGKWAVCEADYTADDLLGRPCYAGLDLAKTLDMTALALLFPPLGDEDEYRQLVYLWMPEETVVARSHLASYRAWQHAGWLEVTPGGSCDYDFVKQRILETNELFDMRELTYDRQFASYFTQDLAEKHGIERVEFGQTVMNFADPTTEYERLINTGKLLHNGNPVLTWQAGHVRIWSDANKNIRPIKPKRGDYRTIDGIVAGIMALGRAMLATDKMSHYNENDLFVI